MPTHGPCAKPMDHVPVLGLRAGSCSPCATLWSTCQSMVHIQIHVSVHGSRSQSLVRGLVPIPCTSPWSVHQSMVHKLLVCVSVCICSVYQSRSVYVPFTSRGLYMFRLPVAVCASHIPYRWSIATWLNASQRCQVWCRNEQVCPG